MSNNTQLTTADGYDIKRMIFSDPQQGSIPNSVPPISYKRISIQTRNEDGTTGDLIFPTSQLFSFGVNENKELGTDKINGYVMPLCLHNRDGASKEEKAWSDTFNNVVEACKEYLLSNREEIGHYDLTMSDLKKFNPLYIKKEKTGKPVDGTGPTCYAKLIIAKKQNKIISMFYDTDGEEIDPMSLLKKFCYVKAAVKIESIFIGSKITLQVKLYECEVRLADTGMKRMMKKRPEGQSTVVVSNTVKPLDEKEKGNESDSEASVNDSEDEDESKPVVKPMAAKQVVVAKPVVQPVSPASSPKQAAVRKVKKVVRKQVAE
jgi:hypothetical protein